MKCPMCKGIGKLEKPKHLNDREEKHAAALLLHDHKFSVRQIMRIVGYKSPNTVQVIIKAKGRKSGRTSFKRNGRRIQRS